MGKIPAGREQTRFFRVTSYEPGNELTSLRLRKLKRDAFEDDVPIFLFATGFDVSFLEGI